MVAPSTLLSDVVNSSSDLYTTPVVSAPAGTLILSVMSGGANPVPSSPVNSVQGLGLTWTLLGDGMFVNSRGSCTVWSAYGATPSSGNISIGFPSQQTRIAYALMHSENIVKQSSANESGGTSVTATLPDTPDQESGILSAVIVNATNMSPVGADGQVTINDDIVFSNPSGRLQTFWQESPLTQDQTFLTNGNISKVAVAVELEPPPPSSSVRAFYVVNGTEVPVSLSHVQAGVEYPATIEF